MDNSHITQKENKPCPVQTGQGLSILYKERYLYSKYAADRSIKQIIQNLTILDNTLILLFSPCLWHGIIELLEKTKAHSNVRLVAIEDDAELFKLASKELKAEWNITLITSRELPSLFDKVYLYRRSLPVDMSGGTFFNSKQYEYDKIYAQNTIGQFWKNRITLVKLGRLFSRNFLKNLKKVPANHSVTDFYKKIDSPIVVFGAGQGLEELLNSIRDKNKDLNSIFAGVYIIAVDAALSALKKHNITPDFVVAVESQLASEKCYIGSTDMESILLCDMTSRISLSKKIKSPCAFFTSEYDKTSFICQAEHTGILPPFVPPLGSVGLTATFIALQMRSSDMCPVFVTGLDFSFTEGFTHARGTPAHTTRLFKNTRFVPVQNYDAAYRTGAQKVMGKTSPVVTDITLKNYADLFTQFFAGTKNLFDAGKSGLSLGIPLVSERDFIECAMAFGKKLPPLSFIKNTEDKTPATQNFIQEHRENLLRIKELLSKGQAASPAPSPDLQTEIKNRLEKCGYLYLHFPDGYVCKSDDLSFLKRVRSELDFFIKDLS